MKKITLLLILFIGLTASSQVSLKGVKLGEIYTGESPIQTTVAEIEGKLRIYTLKDGRVYSLLFQPDGNDLLELMHLETLIEGAQSNYGVELKKNKDGEFYSYLATKEGVVYSINVVDTDVLFSYSFSINDEALTKLRRIEVKSDF
jgi:hypothetical protein